MSNALKDLYDYKVFKYFDEISAVPRASKNRKPIADYCENFAKENNLEYYRDEFDNVIIIKEATKGYENADTVIIQGHLDMVAEKESDSTHDFDNEGLELIIDGDYIKANKTTLGGDDGIAVAYALALLTDNTLSHPRLKAIFTADEEIGLLGATDLSEKYLDGKYMINIDSEEEGIFLNSCAGGQNLTASIEYGMQENPYKRTYDIKIDGLFGGHSGAEIDKNRANAGKILGNLLAYLEENTEYGIAYIDGGKKDNAIMRYATVKVCTDNENVAELVNEFAKNTILQYADIESGIEITALEVSNADKCITPEATSKLVALLTCTPNGVIQFQNTDTHYVQTSLNLGVLTMNSESIEVGFLVRSSIDFVKESVIRELKLFCKVLGIKFNVAGNYPGWAVKKDSKLVEIMSETYEKMFGKIPVVTGIHAGLECGIFYKKNPNLDIVSMGPEMHNIHTPQERLSISSTKRMWDYIVAVLKNLK